jgi:hypothetical protein
MGAQETNAAAQGGVGGAIAGSLMKDFFGR